ncbi:MAG TPA: phosphoglucomutase/phosphomannomutase family protein, partial [Alphaproteobacteria bacterium]|nr:phosphoglucomutase/phosphomannomutase family protein [Alphaproteobacteria bacterium]
GRPVSQVIRTDGLKVVFGDGAWVCYRLSGTEPVVRIYSEARTEADLKTLTAAARAWVME